MAVCARGVPLMHTVHCTAYSVTAGGAVTTGAAPSSSRKRGKSRGLYGAMVRVGSRGSWARGVGGGGSASASVGAAEGGDGAGGAVVGSSVPLSRASSTARKIQCTRLVRAAFTKAVVTNVPKR